MGKFSNEKFDHESFSTKKCPYCQTHLPVDAEQCSACGKNVGEVEKHGTARKPTDWISYVVCIVAWIVFIVYIWWAFF
jgi:predicted amidophosphoribosyltransferase